MDRYLGYFGLNCALELLAMRLSLPAVRFGRLCGVVLILNLSTHPPFWYVATHAFKNYWSTMLVGEALVFTVEIIVALRLLKDSGHSRARVAAAVAGANALSLLFTFVI